MSQQLAQVGTSTTAFGKTERRDAWWVSPLLVGLGFGAFIVYTTYRALSNQYYEVGPMVGQAHLLSPFYSPLIKPEWLPAWFSPAIFILWGPGGFRATCYYYRKAYYRAYFADPPACAVGEPRGHSYKGETRLLLFQNLHRFFLYVALIIWSVLIYDAVLTMIWPTADGGHEFGFSVASIVFWTNIVLLGMYQLGCHSLRHLVGGKLDCFDCEKFTGKARYQAWRGVTWLNVDHMRWAWLSLISVALVDVYVLLVATGVISDYRIF